MLRVIVPVALLAALAACEAAPERFDVIIRGGDVYDGANTAPQRVDVAIAGDRIARLGDLSSASAAQIINASGLTVAPGFIDVQSRSGTTLLADGYGESHLRQGVTTAIIGDVDSPAFWTPQTADVATLKPFGIDFDWTGIDGYFERLQQRGSAINVGTLIPLTRTRGTTAEIDTAMRHGALGLAFTRGDTSSAAVGIDQLIALARTVATYEGVLAVNLEAADERLMTALHEALRIAEAARAPLVIYQPTVSAEAVGPLIAAIRDARARGVNVTTTMTPAFEGEALSYSQWLRDSGASIGSGAAAVRAGSVLERQNVPSRAYDTFATVLARYVREQHVLSLGDAIRRMTSAAAAQFRLQDRGVLRVGLAADVVVFDAAAVSGPQHAKPDDEYATGVRHVVVNGVPVLDGNGLTGARPGRALLGPRNPQ